MMRRQNTGRPRASNEIIVGPKTVGSMGVDINEIAGIQQDMINSDNTEPKPCLNRYYWIAVIAGICCLISIAIALLLFLLYCSLFHKHLISW